MTLLEIVNTVLVKLRLPQVTTTSENPHAALVTQLVNEARREVEDAWLWMALRSTITVTTVNGASQYILTNVGNSRFKVMEVINDTSDYVMKNVSSREMTSKFLFGEVPTDSPTHYAFNGFDGNGDPIVDLYPVPDGVYDIRFNLVIPQNDTTSGTTQIKVPGHIVVLGAYMKALAERGEDASSGYEVAATNYAGALASAVSQEEALMPSETDWRPV